MKSSERTSDTTSEKSEKPSKLARQLALIERLHSANGVTVDQLAVEFDCSRRTIFRDLASLEEAGYRLRLDNHSSAYRVAPHFSGVQPMRLLSDELLILALAANTSPLAKAKDVSNILDQVIGKLLSKVPSEKHNHLIQIMQACQIWSADHSGFAVKAGVLRKIFMALADAASLRIECQDASGRKTIWEPFTPLAVKVEGDQWVVEGRAAGQSKPKELPLSQIVDVQVITEGRRGQQRPHFSA